MPMTSKTIGQYLNIYYTKKDVSLCVDSPSTSDLQYDETPLKRSEKRAKTCEKTASSPVFHNASMGFIVSQFGEWEVNLCNTWPAGISTRKVGFLAKGKTWSAG